MDNKDDGTVATDDTDGAKHDQLVDTKEKMKIVRNELLPPGLLGKQKQTCLFLFTCLLTAFLHCVMSH